MPASLATAHRCLKSSRKSSCSRDVPISVLIQGETGTGKELVAEALHQNSRRAQEQKVTVNCAAIPSELMENEMFGHDAEAYTGATKEHRGKFEQAHKGTLFLDEIGGTFPSPSTQIAPSRGER